jgi:signal peptidase I
MKPRRLTSSAGSALRELLETVLFILLIFFIFRGVVQNFRIEGQSMEPSFHDRQYIWVNKVVYFHFDYNAPLRILPGYRDLPTQIVYPYRTPQRGDVVVLEPPGYDGQGSAEDYIKRVIGLPGEMIQIKDGLVYIDGEPLLEGTAEGGYIAGTTDCYGGRLCQPYTIPEGHVVVLGDNRGNSQDSRTWPGEPALPYDRIVGKAWLSYWPQEDWGIIASPSYAEPAR